MGHIHERPTKKGRTHYQVEIRRKGHPTLFRTFHRKTDAEKWMHKTEADLCSGRYQVYLEGRQRTLRDAIERYRQTHKISVVKRGHLDWWQKELGSYFLSEIRPALIMEKKFKLLSETTAKGVVRSGSTCNRYLATLSHLMSFCVKQMEWIEENPTSKITKEKEPRERTRFLSPDERGRLLNACKESDNPYLLIFVVLQLSTGARYNEIRRLRWTDVDLIKGRVTFMETKNGDIRSVPIRGFALDLLQRLTKEQVSIGFVFPSKNRSQPLDLRRAYRTALKRARLKNFRGHDIRHSYATEMLAQGLSLAEIGHLLGHKSVAMTRRYAHLVESRSADAVGKMTEEIFREVTDV